jgi:hypothetical protein
VKTLKSYAEMMGFFLFYYAVLIVPAFVFSLVYIYCVEPLVCSVFTCRGY